MKDMTDKDRLAQLEYTKTRLDAMIEILKIRIEGRDLGLIHTKQSLQNTFNHEASRLKEVGGSIALIWND